jgi:putative ABC transport system permease protein
MERVFGLPAGPFTIGLVIALAAAVGTVGVVAARNRVFVKIGLRNIPRRRGRSALIVLGLMLGTTIIASALMTGDTVAATIRSSVVATLGHTDETVTAGADAAIADADLEATKPYFPAAPALDAVTRATRGLPVDGVTAAIIEPVAAQNARAKRTEPQLTLFALDVRRAAEFAFDEVTDLEDDEVLLNEDAAKELDARPGDELTLLAGDRLTRLRVAGVGTYPGAGTDGAAAVTRLTTAQAFLGRAGEVNHVLVSNRGTPTSGVAHTDAVEPALDEAVARLGLAADPAKRDGLDAANETGNAFVQLFTTFGSFSIAAGILLIFLIFVMLAAERRPEMGMARAIGTQRRHLVQTFVYEGAVYDLAAAAVGTALGIGVSYVMVQAIGAAFSAEDLDLTYSLTGSSLVTSYAIGVLLTLVVVTASAWRVSRLNIVSAIRDIPELEQPRRRRRRRWIAVAAGTGVGAAMAAGGISSNAYLPWMLGTSIAILSLVPVVKVVGRSERLAYTAAGSFLLVFWLLPLNTFDGLFGEMSMDFSIWIASGLIIVVAATWLVTYNADVFLGVAWRLASPFRSLRPIARMAVAYPLKSRFRTGVTMAMFMLVVFTLVTGSTIPAAFINSFDNVHRFGGNFDVRVTTAPAAGVTDLRAALPATAAANIVATGAQSYVPIEARQVDGDGGFERYALRGLDDGFLDHTTYELTAVASGYGNSQQAWAAVAATPGLAVVDAFVVPRRDNWAAGVLPDFQLSGFYLEDGTFDAVPVTIRDAVTGRSFTVTVIGVLSDSAPYEMAGISVSQRVVAPLGERALPTVHHVAVRAGANPEAVAAEVEAALLARGAEAETYRALLDTAVGASLVFIRIIQGFMGLGLIVGVAALGVISARAVVERRQQLGMLRAIGFQRSMIRRTLLAETSIVALTAIGVGAGLGLLVSFNVIADVRQQAGYAGVDFAVPWINLGLIFSAVIVAALLTTLVSALRATRLYPAEALRYHS